MMIAKKAAHAERRQPAVDYRPGKNEDRFHVEEDKEHCDHVEADGKSAASVAEDGNAAFIGCKLGFGILVASNEPGTGDHANAHAYHNNDLNEQRQIIPEVILRMH